MTNTPDSFKPSDAEEKRYAELQLMALDLARHGSTDPLAAMVRAGLPVNLSDHKGNTLLMLASYNGQTDTARMLLEQGAEADRPNDRGQTPLGGVAFKGYIELAQLLLKHGAEIDKDNGGGMTPIMFAALFGRSAMVTLLEQHGASLKKRARFGLSAGAVVRVSRWFTKLLNVVGFGRKPASGRPR